MSQKIDLIRTFGFGHTKATQYTHGYDHATYARLGAERLTCLLAAAEGNRRERSDPNLPTDPIPGLPVEMDYAASGVVLEQALQHLRESVPNGQRVRTVLAFTALREAVERHGQWLRLKGYDV